MNNQKVESKINLTPITAYLTGVIIGDGHLSNSVKSKKNDLSKDYRINLDISDKEYLICIFKLINSIIKTKTTPRKPLQRGNRIPRLNLQIRNKELFNFLNKVMEIPKGAKSSIVFVPSKIKNSVEIIKKWFLAGYFDTDGGFRGNTLGFTTASKRLHEDTSKLLDEFRILYLTEKWVNKNYDKIFYGIKIRKVEIDKFLSLLPLQNKEKLIRIYNRFNCGSAGVAKRDRLRSNFCKIPVSLVLTQVRILSPAFISK